MVELVGISTLLFVCTILTVVGFALFYISLFYWDCPATSIDRILTMAGGTFVLAIDWYVLQDILHFVGWL